MKVLNTEKGHDFVITATTVTRGRRFITGTPKCSYYMQNSE